MDSTKMTPEEEPNQETTAALEDEPTEETTVADEDDNVKDDCEDEFYDADDEMFEDTKEVYDYDENDTAKPRTKSMLMALLALAVMAVLVVGQTTKRQNDKTDAMTIMEQEEVEAEDYRRRTQSSSSSAFATKQVRFYITGDAPYDLYQAAQLESYMERIPSDAEFVVHVGDMRYAGDKATCTSREYAQVANIMKKSRAPVFMLVGDNDIADCPNTEQAWSYWRRSLDMLWEQWGTGFHRRQTIGRLSGTAGTGTWSFVLNDIFFMGVHLTDTSSPHVREQTVWAIDSVRAYLQQVRPRTGRIVLFGHAGPEESDENYLFFSYLSRNLSFEGAPPLLYIQGDWHYWDAEEKFFGMPNWMRFTVAGETEEGPTQVTVTSTGGPSDARVAFRYRRRS